MVAVVLPSQGELAGRILVTMVLSGLVGLEREITDKTAGLRTHISVALGAALFGMVSAYGFAAFGDLPRSESSYHADVSRVASQVVTGVGFLGGGAILKHGVSVRGLTTAGSLWVTAAIGLAVGLGAYFLAVASTLALLVSLIGLKRPNRWVQERLASRVQTVVITLVPGADPSGVIQALHRLPELRVRSLSVRVMEERSIVQADLEAPSGDLEVQLGAILRRGDVEEVDL